MLRRVVICASVLGAALPAAGQSTTFSSNADLVVLHAMVTDRRGVPVTGLTEQAFEVFEDGRPQQIRFLLESDAPISAGLLIDSSGSMFDVRTHVMAAAEAFLETRDPRDELFAMSFNEHVRAVLPATMPFTGDPAVLRDRLGRHIGARGRTALYDAILAGLDHVARGSTHRKVLIVIADGGDNASRATFPEVLARARSSDTVIYAVALDDPVDGSGGNTGSLRRLADATGGLVIRPRRARAIAAAFRQITDDLSSGYTLAYVPEHADRDGRFRPTRVTASVGGRTLTVRSRPGYVIPARDRETGQ